MRTCVFCSASFKAPKPSSPMRYCSVGCANRSKDYAAPAPCQDCGETTDRKAGRGGVRRCEDCRHKARRNDYRHKNYQRRHATPPPTKKITLAELGARDGWRCHLCRRKVDPALKSPHDLSPTMDHLEPVANGGDHEPVNLALAHRICNTLRSNRGPAQLALIG